jgi:hypothetical protein
MPRKISERQILPAGPITLGGSTDLAKALAKTIERIRQPVKNSYTLEESVRYLKSQGKKYSKRTLERHVENEAVAVKRTLGGHLRFPKSTLDALP